MTACPSSHRFAFSMGTKCCRYNMESIRSASEELSAEISAELSSLIEGRPKDGDAYYGYDDNATYGDDYGQLKGLVGKSGCNGGRLFYDSECCKDNEFVECTHPNYTMAETPFTCIDGRGW